MVDCDLSIWNGELTQNMGVRRHVVAARHAALIREMFAAIDPIGERRRRLREQERERRRKKERAQSLLDNRKHKKHTRRESDENIAERIKNMWSVRADRYSEERGQLDSRTKVEMSYIGG